MRNNVIPMPPPISPPSISHIHQTINEQIFSPRLSSSLQCSSSQQVSSIRDGRASQAALNVASPTSGDCEQHSTARAIDCSVDGRSVTDNQLDASQNFGSPRSSRSLQCSSSQRVSSVRGGRASSCLQCNSEDHSINCVDHLPLPAGSHGAIESVSNQRTCHARRALLTTKQH